MSSGKNYDHHDLRDVELDERKRCLAWIKRWGYDNGWLIDGIESGKEPPGDEYVSETCTREEWKKWIKDGCPGG